MTIASGNKALAADVLKSLNASGYLQLADLTATTIASGAISVTKNYYSVDTEGAAATDNLDTITAGSDVNDGHLLFIRPASDARTVIVKHGTGNIKTFGGNDIYLDDSTDALELIYDGTLSTWLAINNWAVVDNSTLQISSGTLSIKAGGVGTSHMAADAVDDTIAGNRVARLVRRQGGHATNWSTAGSTDYTPTGVLMQCGSNSATIGAGFDEASSIVTFPVAFSGKPVVLVTEQYTDSTSSINTSYYIDVTSASAFQLYARLDAAAVSTVQVGYFWLAIGPE